MSQELFAEWAKEEPELAAKVGACDLEGVEFCTTRMGEANIKVDGRPQHAQYGAAKECQRLLQDVDLEAVEVLYCYGIGLGHLYGELREWLHASAGRYLVFVEEDLRILAAAVRGPWGKELVQDPQLILAYAGETEAEAELLCQQMSEYFLNLRFHLLGSTAAVRRPETRWDSWRLWMMHRCALIQFGSKEFMNHGVTFFNNFYRNLQSLPGSCRAAGLTQRFQGVPAIICGAGPSLNKNFELLRSLSDRALLFAGGSAIKALCNRGLLPHFGGSVDPNPLQFERMSTHCGYEVPMFYKGRVFHRALRAFHGPRIYLPGNNGYPVARWVERQLGYEDSPPREGFNVLHLLIDLARNLGCDPIIFVGMDLAFTGLQSYASAVEQSSAVNEAEITGGKDLNNNAFLREGVDGRPVYTLWKWVGESNYTNKYALQHPETTFINATEGGLGVPGVPNQSLREVADRYLQKTWDLQAWVHAELQSHPLKLDQAKPLSGILEDLKESLERCLAQLEDMIEASQVLVDAVTEGLQAQIQAQSELIAEGQEALSKEEAYTWILDPLNEVRSLVFERGWKEIERATHFSGEKERVQAFFKAQAQELSCLHEACRLNLHILQRSLEGFEAGTVLQAEAPPPQLMDSPGLQGSELLTFWGDGHVAGKSQWKSAQRHGESELYYPDGTVYARLHFAEGVPDGWQRYFYADGSLKTEVFYKRGRVSGQVRLFFPNGQEKKHIDYQDGVIHGWQREWDKQGRQVMEQHFRQGRLLEERYWVDGVLVEEKTYHSEVPVADTRKWDQRGVLRIEETFEGTRFVHREWGEDGSLEREFGGFWQGGQSTIDRLVCGQLYPGERARYQP